MNATPKRSSVVLAMVTAFWLSFFGFGCATLEKSGPYNGDEVLYRADLVIVTSTDVFKAFVKWEYVNREALKDKPQVKEAADKVRRNAKQWVSSAMVLRDAYRANPTDEARTKLQTSLAVLQAALSESTHYLAEQ